MPTLGETLRSTREEKRIKLAQVVDKTNIPAERLQALESDRYFDLPDDVYLKGAIRNYALFLGLNPSDMLTLYRQARPEDAKLVPLSTARTTRAVAVIPTTVAVVTLLVLILIALVALHIVIL